MKAPALASGWYIKQQPASFERWWVIFGEMQFETFANL